MIRWLLQSTLCLVLCPLLVAQQAAPPTASADAPQPSMPAPATDTPRPLPEFVTVPKGTEIELVMLDSLSSATNKRGDTIRFAVAKDVIVDGIVAIHAGTPVTGIVTAVKKMIPHKSSGQICVRAMFIDKAGHRGVLLTYDPSLEDRGLFIAVVVVIVVTAPIVIAIVIALLPIALPIRAVKFIIKKRSNRAGKNAKVTDDMNIPLCKTQTVYLKSAIRIRVAEIAASSPGTAADLSHCALSSMPVTQK
jgi:hypothetical protein